MNALSLLQLSFRVRDRRGSEGRKDQEGVIASSSKQCCSTCVRLAEGLAVACEEGLSLEADTAGGAVEAGGVEIFAHRLHELVDVVDREAAAFTLGLEQLRPVLIAVGQVVVANAERGLPRTRRIASHRLLAVVAHEAFRVP